MVDLKDCMTTGQAAQELGLDVQTVRRLARNGVLQSEKFGRFTLVLIASVKEYQYKNNQKSKNDPTRNK
jgi:excisionase family DNA binding protein